MKKLQTFNKRFNVTVKFTYPSGTSTVHHKLVYGAFKIETVFEEYQGKTTQLLKVYFKENDWYSWPVESVLGIDITPESEKEVTR